MNAAARIPLLDWGVSVCALDGASACGDHYLVAEVAEGLLLVVVDGLGHGPEASLAAEIAVEVLAAGVPGSVNDMLLACHARLKTTRGAVLSLACFHPDQTLSWSGVGNVEGRLLRADGGASCSLLLRPGVLGFRLPPLRVENLPVFPGDTLILVTDGISYFRCEDIPAQLPPQALAEFIMARFGKSSDDALVLVARYGGLLS